MTPAKGYSQLPSFIEERLDKQLHSSWNTIMRQGSQPRHFFCGAGTGAVLGEFRILSNSKRVLVKKRNNGSLIGFDELENGHDNPTCVIPLTDSIVYRGDQSDIDYFRSSYPDAFQSWVWEKQSSETSVYRKLDRLLCLKLKERLAIELLEFVDCLGHRVHDGMKINTKLSRNNLGDILGCTHESISRILSEWTEKNVISTDQKIITVHRPGILKVETPSGYEVPELTSRRMKKKNVRAKK